MMNNRVYFNLKEKDKNIYFKTKELLGGELNPGHSRDRRIYLTTILPRTSFRLFEGYYFNVLLKTQHSLIVILSKSKNQRRNKFKPK